MFWKTFIELCNKKGVAPNFVAKILGFSTGTVTWWKKGRLPRDTALLKLSEYFGVSVDYLLGKNTGESFELTSDAFWENYVRLCSKVGLSPNAVAKKLSISSGAVTRWKNGSVPQSAQLLKIADYFSVPVSVLTGETPEKAPAESSAAKEPSNIGAVMSGNIHLIPVFESVSAGFGTMAQEYVVDYYPCLIGSEAEAEETIIIRVKGDSMFPKIEDGDLIQVHKQSCVDSGEVAVVLVEGTDCFVKKVEYGENWVELHSFNPMYPVMRFTGTDIQKIRIIGRVRKVIKSI